MTTKVANWSRFATPVRHSGLTWGDVTGAGKDWTEWSRLDCELRALKPGNKNVLDRYHDQIRSSAGSVGLI